MPPQAPDTLPANFTAWDEAPDTLPANFSGFDVDVPKLQQPVRVESSVSDKILGALAPQSVPRTAGAGRTQADMPGFEGSYASGDEGKGLAMTGAGIAAGAALASPATISALRAAAAAHPLAAKLAIKALEGLGFATGIRAASKLSTLYDLMGGPK